MRLPGSPQPYRYGRGERHSFAAMADDILATGVLSLGPYTQRFEEACRCATGAAFAVAVSTGTSALEIILNIVGVRDRAVLVPTNTNYATALAAMNAGGRVVLVDGGPWLDADAYAASLGADVAAVIPVHIGGCISPDLDAVLELSAEHGIAVVEDAAHAHGARLRGKHAGTFGLAGAFSFAQSKVMALGEGGLVVTDQAALADEAREYRNQGKVRSEVHRVWGNSWRMSELQAALGLVRLGSLADSVRRRQEIMRIYRRVLEGSNLTVHAATADMEPSGYKCMVELPETVDRAELVARLRSEHGVEVAHGVYHVPLHRQPLFESVARGRSFPRADRFADRHVCVPLNPDMSDDQAEAVATVVRDVAAALQSGGGRRR